MNTHPKTMRAAVIHRFGDPEELIHQEMDVPEIGPRDVLIGVAYAGIGEWDAFERQGGYAEMLNMDPAFPYILGSEGSGIVIARGDKVSSLDLGDQVYAPAFLNPHGGFYAEYAAVDAKYVSRIPDGLTMQEAAVISGVGITALRGLEDVLQLQRGESILIFGASGGVGHIAVQIAKALGARVFAVASGEDGVELMKKLGCDAVVNGRDRDISSIARRFAPSGFDTAMFTAGGEAADAAVSCLRKGGRLVFPHGISPELRIPPGIKAAGYNGEPDPEIIARLQRYITQYKLTVHISHVFALKEANWAHAALHQHYVGKICLKVKETASASMD
ncbi:zinc-binding dehydrogenase [Paenibacillus ihbetae]|uniref:Zinc-binding dehydrogenase n=1 Tax=Paenibacillus ihbetae TaxID=1870820 RepID=A0A1B2DTW9_9BACL|nr:NADP-dependent oxidoreductase [Paenibacillus ihbetae]ANY71155.1 zinc-binding dehydrogenase [Paenibacillus ihbetae]